MLIIAISEVGRIEGQQDLGVVGFSFGMEVMLEPLPRHKVANPDRTEDNG